LVFLGGKNLHQSLGVWKYLLDLFAHVQQVVDGLRGFLAQLVLQVLLIVVGTLDLIPETRTSSLTSSEPSSRSVPGCVTVVTLPNTA
jgi:hypothetical protein